MTVIRAKKPSVDTRYLKIVARSFALEMKVATRQNELTAMRTKLLEERQFSAKSEEDNATETY